MRRHKKAESPSKPATALKMMEDVEDEPDLMMFTPAAAGIEVGADAVSSPKAANVKESGASRKTDGRQPWWTRRLWTR